MSMVPASGHAWPGAAAAFLCMWILMMAPMMLPSLIPMLLRYRHAVDGAGGTRLVLLTALVCVAYFVVWTAVGVLAYSLGAAVTTIGMRQSALTRFVPVAAVVLIAGALQFTAWKARHLECCREAPGRGRVVPPDARTAWRHGLSLGLHCSYACAGLTAILLVVGMMDLRAMVAVTAAITFERFAPTGPRAAHAVGAVVVVSGLFLVARAAGLA
jgi:predicted metal-binding membrane protein